MDASCSASGLVICFCRAVVAQAGRFGEFRRSCHTSTLPAGLKAAMLHYGEFSQGTEKLAESYHICRIDLNGDGADEYIIKSRESYSGGPQMYVFQRRQHHFDCIADFAGSVYFGPCKNGYFEIVSQTRGGRYVHPLTSSLSVWSLSSRATHGLPVTRIWR